MTETELRDERINSLLHYMKGAEKFSMTFSTLTKGWRQWCPFTHKKISVDTECYHRNPSVQSLLLFCERYLACCRYLDVHPYVVSETENILNDLRVPERMKYIEEFADLIKRLKNNIDIIEPDVTAKLKRFTCLECQRLDEAIVSIRNYCFYSSIVMAVSSVEARIAQLIRHKNRKIFEKHFAKATLGQLIQVFDDKHYTDPSFGALKKLISAKHKPLLELLNHYRVFSAHPMKERVTAQIAEAILKLSFTFMIDPNTCIYTSKELQCK